MAQRFRLASATGVVSLTTIARSDRNGQACLVNEIQGFYAILAIDD